MPYLIILGIIVVGIAAAIFRVNKWQADKYVRLAQQAKMAEDADDVQAEEFSDVDEKDEK